MTRVDLVAEVMQDVPVTRAEAETIVETVLESVLDSVCRGEKVELRGLGTFRTRNRGPRIGRNPRTGERVDVPPKKVPYFKPSRHLLEAVANLPDSDG